MELGEFTLSIIINLLSSVIHDGIKSQPYFQRRKIERRIEDATAEVVEPLLPFLAHEGISEDKQRRLIETCVEELRPLTNEPELLFQGSLNGQKIFEDLYSNRDLPRVVIEDGLKETYTLLCPRIATLLCKIPAAVKDWESEAWSENFRRFDEITDQLRTLFHRVDELATFPQRDADELLNVVRRALAQKIRFDLDLTGLRGDSPRAGKFDDFFVHPEIAEDIENSELTKVVGHDTSFDLFTATKHRPIIIGQPGSGKSTWAKWLQREALSTRWNGVCVRIELRRFSNGSSLSLHEMVREVAGQHLAEELTADRISDWVKKKKVIFILDGFDEIRPSDRDRVYDWIFDLSTAAQDCAVILTSRPLTTDHINRLRLYWKAWVICPFDNERILSYIQRWYSHMPLLAEGNNEVDPVVLAKGWLQDPTISPLTGNPLLLSTLLMVHHLDGSLPSGRSLLYRRYVEGMLGLWDDRRKVTATSIQLTLEEKRQIMRRFALQMFLQQKDIIDENDAFKLIQDLLQRLNISLSGEEVLAGLRERSGLIIGPGIYSFVHKSVLEYLVAESVLQGDQVDESGHRIDRFCLFEHRDDDRWNTVTFLWAGLASIADVESFISQCMDAQVLDLACGVLYDQYNKFPTEIRRQLLLKVIGIRHKLSYEDVAWAGYLYKNTDAQLAIPSFTLRSIVSSRNFLHHIICKAVVDKTLSWLDRTYAQGKMRDLLWMCCVISLQNIEEWKACLASPCPDISTEEAWLNWVAQANFKKASRKGDSAALREILEAYKVARPKFRALVPIALMSIVVYLSERSFLRNELTEIHVDFPTILDVLPDSGDGEMIEDLLQSTCNWVDSTYYNMDDFDKDLLNAFAKAIEKLVEEGNLEKDASFERTVNFVSKLREHRDSLATKL